MTSIGRKVDSGFFVIVLVLTFAPLTAAELSTSSPNQEVQVADPFLLTVALSGYEPHSTLGGAALWALDWETKQLSLWTSYRSDRSLDENGFVALGPADQIRALRAMARERGWNHNELSERLDSTHRVDVFRELRGLEFRPRRSFPMGVTRYRKLQRAEYSTIPSAQRSYVVLFDYYSNGFFFDEPGQYELWVELTDSSNQAVSNRIRMKVISAFSSGPATGNCSYLDQLLPINRVREEENQKRRLASISAQNSCHGYSAVSRMLASLYFAERLAERLENEPTVDRISDWDLASEAGNYCEQVGVSASPMLEVSCGLVNWATEWIDVSKLSADEARAEAADQLKPLVVKDRYLIFRDIVDQLIAELQAGG